MKRLPQGLMVAAHVSRIYGPVQALVGYLAARRASFRFVSLPFGFSGIPHATEAVHQGGKAVAVSGHHAARGPEPLLWARDFLLVLRRGWRAGAGRKLPLFIGVDCLNASAGVLLRWAGRCERVVFYAIDYTPQRFSNPLLNLAYALADRFAATQADAVWNLSDRMREVRRRQGVPEARNQLVPVGVELAKVRRPARVKRHSLFYMGALMDNKGLQLLVQAMPLVLKKVPQAELHILGFGPFEAELKRLVQASPARARIHLPGGLEHGALFKVAPGFGVALAPYLDDPGSYTWWCDPTKPKEYLACGLPIIITKVPWIWERIADAREPMGLAIDYELDQLVGACVRLLTDDVFYRQCRRHARRFAQGLDWARVFDQAFATVPAGELN
jgi:glycosyltransferase involved in cell wall biosynthesis